MSEEKDFTPELFNMLGLMGGFIAKQRNGELATKEDYYREQMKMLHEISESTSDELKSSLVPDWINEDN